MVKNKHNDFRTYFAGLYKEAEEILVGRQAQYGRGNIESLGVPGVFSRMSDDKVSRIKKALNGQVVKGRIILSEESLKELQHPSVRDALIDSANYCLILLCLIDNKWSELELSEEDRKKG